MSSPEFPNLSDAIEDIRVGCTGVECWSKPGVPDRACISTFRNARSWSCFTCRE